jgi:hypothetical protein
VFWHGSKRSWLRRGPNSVAYIAPAHPPRDLVPRNVSRRRFELACECAPSASSTSIRHRVISFTLTATTPAPDGFRLDDHQAFEPLRPPERQQDPKQPINTPETRATSSAALQYGNLMAQRDRFQRQRSAGWGFASGDRDCSACRDRHERRLSPGVRNHQ